MQAREYENLFAAEDRLWWFRALRKFIDILLPPRVGERMLDIGCGTGGLLRYFIAQGRSVIGIDYSMGALVLAHSRGGTYARADAMHLPFARHAFDAVTCVDLLELASVQPSVLATEATRVLRPGGRGLFVAAAHQWLLSEHDRAVNSVHRWKLAELGKLFTGFPISIKRKSYLFAWLFPPVALRKMFNKPNEGESKSDVRLLPWVIDTPLYWLCWLEAQLLRVTSCPFGSSAVVVMEKNA